MNATPFFPALRPVLAPMKSRLRSAVAPLRRATLSQLERVLAPALPQDLLRRPASGDHSRRRVYDLPCTFWGWLWQVLQANTSCREVVSQLDSMRQLLGLAPVDEGTSAYCQARAKLPQTLLARAFTASAQSAARLAPPGRLLQARPIKVVDGSTVRLEDTPANRKEYPTSPNQFGRPDFPLLRVLVLFSLASGALLAHVTGAFQVAEVRLLLALGQHLSPGDILLADRAYCHDTLLHWLQGLRVDLLARLDARSRRVDFRRALQRLGPGDALFEWSRPQRPSVLLSAAQWALVPTTLTVRIIYWRVTQPGFRTRELWLVTSLLDPQLYPAEELLAAYARRWRLEMCFDDLKTTLGMEMLRCRTPALVRKELLVFLTAHNCLRWIMAQAAKDHGVDLERLSFKGTMDSLRQWSAAIAQAHGPGQAALRRRLWHSFLRRLAGDLVPDRPGRMEPHAIKKKSKYPRLTQPRHRYIERWGRNKRARATRAKRRALLN